MNTVTTSSGWPCSPEKRVFIESGRSEDPTFALDFYAAQKAPGFGPGGLVMGSRNAVSCVVLYRVQKNVITNVWCGVDKEAIAADDDLTEEEFNETDTIKKVCKSSHSAALILVRYLTWWCVPVNLVVRTYPGTTTIIPRSRRLVDWDNQFYLTVLESF